MPVPHRRLAAALTGISGTLVMLAMLSPHGPREWPFLLAAATGASLAGYALAGFFGHPGQRGLGFGLAGALFSTLCGAAIAGLGLGVLIGPTLAGVIIGPIAVGQALLTSPLALATWAGTMTATHLVMGQVRTRHLMPS